MKTRIKETHTFPSRTFACAASSLLLLSITSHASIVGPYSVDSTTLHLWHMDQSSTPVLDSVPRSSGGTNLTALMNAATLGNASFSGFGTALNTYNAGPSFTGAASLSPQALPNDNTTLTYADPTTGSFTYEALVQVNYNPGLNLGATAVGGTGRNSPLTILSADGNGGTGSSTRIFTFRLDPIGYQSFAGDTTSNYVRLEFINLYKGSSVQNIFMQVPNSGPDAIVNGGWYHVAVTYNGQANTANNLNFYWTLMDASRTNASLIGSATMTLNLATGGTPNFVVGNAGRNPSGNPANPVNANFLGLIDEVRMSGIARGPSQMMFTAPAITIDTDLTNQVTVLGQTVSFAVSASGLPPLHYQWQHAGTNIHSSDQSVYTISAVTPADAGDYDVIVTNNYSSITSSVATLSIRTPIDLTWVGYGYNWDTSGYGFNDSLGNNTFYTDGDNVTFDTNGASYPSVVLSAPVYPSSVTVNADSDYTFTTTANGGLYGMTGISKQGAGNLFLDVNNSYSGPTVIQGGNLQVGVGGTRGTIGSGVVTNNAGLTFDRTDSISVNNTIVGTGSLTNLGSGTVTLSGNNSFQGSLSVNAGAVTLANSQALGQSTNVLVAGSVGGAGITGTRLALGGGVNVSANVTLSFMNAFAGSTGTRCNLYTSGGSNSWNGPITITDNSDNIIALASDASGALLNINGPITGPFFTGQLIMRGTGGSGVLGGTVNLPAGRLNKTDNSTWTITSTGNSWASTDLAQGILRMGANSALPGSVILNMTAGATLDLDGFNQQLGLLNGTNASAVIGSSSTISDSVLSFAGGPSTNWGVIQDSVSGGTRRVGLTLSSGTLTLTNVNTYSGDTLLSGGTLYLVGAGSILNSSNIDLGQTAVLDVSGRNGAGLLVSAAQTLKGDSLLNINGSLTNAGTIELKINNAGGVITSDMLQVSSTMTYGGTLKLDLSGSPLSWTNTIKLFSAANYAGGFANIVPASPGPSLGWEMGANGTLYMVPLPTLSVSKTSATTLQIHGTGSAYGYGYTLYSSSDLSNPAAWNPIASDVFDTNGNFSVTVPINNNIPQQFFRVQVY